MWSWPAGAGRGPPGCLAALTVTAPPGGSWGCEGGARRGLAGAREGVDPRPRGLRRRPSSQSAEPCSAGGAASPRPRRHGGGCLPPRAHLEQPRTCFSPKLSSEAGGPCPPPAPGATLLAPCAVPPRDTPSRGLVPPHTWPSASWLWASAQAAGCLPHSFRGTREGAPFCPSGPSSSCSPGRRAMPASLVLLP